MDLVRMMLDKRRKEGIVEPKQLSRPEPRQKKQTKAQRAKEIPPGTRQMRDFICAEKPNKSIVRNHMEAKVDALTESSDEE